MAADATAQVNFFSMLYPLLGIGDGKLTGEDPLGFEKIPPLAASCAELLDVGD
jgi:hypothetical protein